MENTETIPTALVIPMGGKDAHQLEEALIKALEAQRKALNNGKDVKLTTAEIGKIREITVQAEILKGSASPIIDVNKLRERIGQNVVELREVMLGGNANIYGYELANEPHCEGNANCSAPYFRWAAAASSAIRSIASVNVGIGQMASTNIGFGDSPANGDYKAGNSAGGITMASGHHYTTDQNQVNIAAKAEADQLGKPFYIGEVGFNGGTNFPVPPAPQVETQYPCTSLDGNSIATPEFHSLRPYPATPCYKKVSQTALFCANDFVAKNTYTFSGKVPFNDGPPGATVACSAIGPTITTTCTYTYIHQQDTVNVNLGNAKLPIMGNTEDVPNRTRTSAGLTPTDLTAAQRMNNYVSWYLNGVVNKAEEDYSAWNSYYLINFSGPVNKLLPWAVQTLVKAGSRKTSDAMVNNSHSTVDKALTTPGKGPIYDTDSRHNQIVGCPVLVGGGGPVPCYLYVETGLGPLLSVLQSIGIISTHNFTVAKDNRLANWVGDHMRPLETDYTDLKNFWRDYLLWLGNICTPQLIGGYYFCVNTGARSPWSMLYNNIPSSTTEDRVGDAFTDKSAGGNFANTTQYTIATGNGAEVSNVSFTPNPGPTVVGSVFHHNLYFAHTQEVAELSKLLQNTYATKSDSKTNWEAAIQEDIARHDPDQSAPITNSNHCEKVDPVPLTNPGDNLYGDLQNEQRIGGTMNYDTTFTCTYVPKNVCPAGCNNPLNPACGCITTYNSCSKDIFVAMGLYTKTPNVQEDFDRLVGCSASGDTSKCQNSRDAMSIFKRFYPKTGDSSPLLQILDIPGITTVSYLASGHTVSGTLAGLLQANRPGTEAQLFFPHLGSMEEYFLRGIQKALRPKGYDSDPLIGQAPADTSAPPPVAAGGQNYLTIDCPGPKTIPIAPSDPSCNNTGAQDYVANCNPNAPTPPEPWASMKQGVHNRVNRIVSINDPRTAGTQIDRCFNDVVDQSLAAGVNPLFTLSIWAQESGASNYWRFGCGLQDFGVNTSIAQGFQAQLSFFLGLVYKYPASTSFAQCFPNNKCSTEGFAQVFQNGNCPITSAGLGYTNKTKDSASVIAPNCGFPIYPTQMTTCH